MRILFVADGRSPIALNWIGYFTNLGYEVHLASTYTCQVDLPLASLEVVPVAFSSAKKSTQDSTNQAKPRGIWSASAVGLRTTLRQWLGPITLPQAANCLRKIIDKINPQLIHAMRIPYEGMLAALARPTAPLLISVWGNDFTLHAPATPLMARLTRLALQRASALHADCYRDIRLAHTWKFPKDRPSIVLPGAGGVQLNVFYPPTLDSSKKTYPGPTPTVINPRGIRAYVRNDTFFKAIPEILKTYPEARFLCPTMAGEPQALNWLGKLGIAKQVELLPHQTRSQMADLFRRSQVVVSPSTHDGTPNTLLEAMACGCLPVAGDIESIREWITPGMNGYLVDPSNSQALAFAILDALKNAELHKRALAYNTRLINERAEHNQVMQSALNYYQKLVK
jgi:glycosyltransferase involved in cell wall biosynthesis